MIITRFAVLIVMGPCMLYVAFCGLAQMSLALAHR